MNRNANEFQAAEMSFLTSAKGCTSCKLNKHGIVMYDLELLRRLNSMKSSRAIAASGV
jgi:hypothetical protein